MTTLLLHRAFNNFGDFLIFERAKCLIEKIAPEENILIGHAGKSLEEQTKLQSVFSSVDRVIIPGGPGVVKNMVPKIYPIAEDCVRNEKPLYTLGVGSYLTHGITVRDFRFDSNTSRTLAHMNKYAPLGTRDSITQKLLQSQNINAKVNGCPAWYDCDSLGRTSLPSRSIQNVVFSAPASFSSIPFFLAFIGAFSKAFPEVGVGVSMNHGFTGFRDRIIKELCEEMGWTTLDLSGGTTNIGVYGDYDFHIGFRVHSHISFLSVRKPSILFSEDLRGVGANESLGLEEIPYSASSTTSSLSYWVARKAFLRRGSRSVDMTKSAETTLSKVAKVMESKSAIYERCFQNIDSMYENEMKPFIIRIMN